MVISDQLLTIDRSKRSITFPVHLNHSLPVVQSPFQRRYVSHFSHTTENSRTP
nr:MAG TPA: hypothetical protein [Caudoviricetes sp.]